MKKALIMGITGAFGRHLAQALTAEGWTLRALVRHPAKHAETLSQWPDLEIIPGDASCREDVLKAAQGIDLLVYGVNPPGYDWEGKALPWLETTAEVAEELGLQVLFPGNVYVLNPAQGPNFSETSPLAPIRRKGQIRQAMEARLQQAAARGARVLILRMGDFMASDSQSSWLGAAIKKRGQGYRISLPGPQNIGHAWAYLPDAAATAVAILRQASALPAYQVFHFQGHHVSWQELSQTLHQATGQKVQLGKFPWWLPRLLAPFSPLFRGLVEMRYLWQREIRLDDSAPRQFLGQTPPQTPLAEAVLKSLA